MNARAELPEQRAIATALSDVDALLAKIDQLIAKKRAEKVPILLDQAELSPIEKALQTEVARAATKALQGRVDKQIAFGRAFHYGHRLDLD